MARKRFTKPLTSTSARCASTMLIDQRSRAGCQSRSSAVALASRTRSVPGVCLRTRMPGNFTAMVAEAIRTLEWPLILAHRRESRYNRTHEAFDNDKANAVRRLFWKENMRNLYRSSAMVFATAVIATAQTLPVKWEELTAGDFVAAIQKAQGTCI